MTLVPYHASLGILVEEVTADGARLRIPYADANSNPGRALHGGVYASAIDVAGGLAARAGVADAGHTVATGAVTYRIVVPA
jgi:uncharacterized protein (TIGR00369 family)